MSTIPGFPERLGRLDRFSASEQKLLYIATGSPKYLFGALYSALSAKAAGNRIPTAIITDSPLQFPFADFDIEVMKPPRIRAEGLKACLNSFTAAEFNLFLDSDTVVLGNLEQLFQSLKAAPLAASYVGRLADVRRVFDRKGRYGRENRVEVGYTIEKYGPETIWLSGGHIAFRKSLTEEFFRTFRREWNRFQCTDEGALCRAIAETGIDVAPLVQGTVGIAKRIVDGVTVAHRVRGMRGRSHDDMCMTAWHKHYYPRIYEELVKVFTRSLV